MNQFLWPLRAAFQRAYPLRTIVQSTTTSISGIKMLIKPGVKGELNAGKFCMYVYMCRIVSYYSGMRYLGVDYGSSRVGLALSDEAGTMGFPHAILKNTKRLIDELRVIIAKENIGAVVIGESRNLAGGENAIAKDARELGSLITERTGVPVFYESEVFTSAEARRAPAKEIKSRAAKPHADVDSSAAALILTSYLSRRDNVKVSAYDINR